MIIAIGRWRIRLHPSLILAVLLIMAHLAVLYLPRHYPSASPTTLVTLSALLTVAILTSILAHELAHVWVAHVLGIPYRTITLHVLGAMAQLEREPDGPSSDTLIALAGPTCSFGLALLCWPWTASPLVAYLAKVNALIALLNLYPGYPLDGGRILRAWLWKRSRSFTIAMDRTLYISQWSAFVLYIVAVTGSWLGYTPAILLVVGLLIHLASLQAHDPYRRSQYLRRYTTGELAHPITALPSPSTHDSDAHLARLACQYHTTILPLQANGRIAAIAVVGNSHVSRYPVTPADWVRDSTPLLAVYDEMMQKNVKGCLVVDENEQLLGLITRDHCRRARTLPEAPAAPAPSTTPVRHPT